MRDHKAYQERKLRDEKLEQTTNYSSNYTPVQTATYGFKESRQQSPATKESKDIYSSFKPKGNTDLTASKG